MTPSAARPRGADRLAGWAAGVGAGSIALMLTWIVGSRIADLVWSPPAAAIVPFAAAVGAGVAVSLVAGLRLTRRTGRPVTRFDR